MHQTNPFVVTAPVDTLDCNGMPRSLNVNFSQVGSFVYAILAARNGDVGATNTSPVGFVQTLNARATDPAVLAGMAGYVGPVSSNQLFAWNVESCWNSAAVGVAIHRMSVP